MKAEHDVDIQTMPSSEPPVREKGRGRLGMIVALVIVALIVGTSAVVFAQLAGRRGPAAGATPSPARQWAAVLNNYEIASLAASPANPNVLYACGLHQSSGNGTTGTKNYTILRSSDGGAHWQDMGNTFGLGTSCDLAVNPANSSDLYVAGATAVLPTASNAASYMLWHSSDGGQTWTAILPSLSAPSLSTATAWQVQQIAIEGGRLYGLQAFPTPEGVAQPRTTQAQTRLVMSADGGHSWTVVDSHFVSTNQSARGFAVDPTSTQTIYDLVGTMFMPYQPGTQPSDTHAQPAFSYTVDLYKTTDGGASWHLLLGHLPYTTQLQLASANPQILYLGGVAGPLPYIAKAEPSYAVPAYGFFQLRVSTDGGTIWKMATSSTQEILIRGWFVSPDGRAFLATAQGGAVPYGSPTAVSSTAVPYSSPTAVSGTVVPTGQEQSSANTAFAAHSVQVLAPATTPPPAYPLIKSYDPATGTWSDVTTAPASGVLIALTPAANNGAVLWLLASNNVTNVLYRYGV